ncbi:MAG: LrgB family protein, partial [Spirochaetia bacterium]
MIDELVAAPAVWVTVSLVLYIGAKRLYSVAGTPLLHPVLVTIAALIAVLTLFGVDYGTYNEGGRIISFFLGPSVVALGVPLAERIRELRSQAPALVVTILAGSVVGIVSAVLPLVVAGAGNMVILSMAPKSVTTPIAMSIVESAGGEPSLAAAFVVLTGIFGAVVGPVLLRIFGVHDPVAYGYALGAASHGIGTARALEEGRTQGAAGSLAICLNG